MKSPYIIAINSVSGGGKTAVARLLEEALPDSVLFCFDEFDETNIYPDDYYDWWKRGADLNEFDCAGMREAVDREIASEEVQFIILDYPFGRDHSRFRDVIDLSVYVDTPLDVAMARRILRDHIPSLQKSAAEVLENLRSEMAHYVAKARYPYLDSDRHKPTADLVLDGWQSLDKIRDQVLERIPRERYG